MDCPVRKKWDHFTSTRLQQDYRLVWDKAQSDYKDHNLKAVTWNNIRKFVELPGLWQILYAISSTSSSNSHHM